MLFMILEWFQLDLFQSICFRQLYQPDLFFFCCCCWNSSFPKCRWSIDWHDKYFNCVFSFKLFQSNKIQNETWPNMTSSLLRQIWCCYKIDFNLNRNSRCCQTLCDMSTQQHVVIFFSINQSFDLTDFQFKPANFDF